MKAKRSEQYPLATATLLEEMYDPCPTIPLKAVRQDYFTHLTPANLVRKISSGELALPLVRMDAGPKYAQSVTLIDLAAYLDRQMEAARKECVQLCGPPPRSLR